jgi:catechol 2,3-dioxygenase-like lactoylglutathione lyase family enzyme
MTVGRIVPVLTVTDLPAAVEHYRAALGLDVVMDHGWIATLADADRRHQLSLMTRDATAAVNPAVSIEVDDVDAAHREALAAGLEIVHPSRGVCGGSSSSTPPATSSTCSPTTPAPPPDPAKARTRAADRLASVLESGRARSTARNS